MLDIWNERRPLDFEEKTFIIKGNLYSPKDLFNLELYTQERDSFPILLLLELFIEFIENPNRDNESRLRDHFETYREYISDLFFGKHRQKFVLFREGRNHTDLRRFLVPLHLELRENLSEDFRNEEVSCACYEYIYSWIYQRKKKDLYERMKEEKDNPRDSKKIEEEILRPILEHPRHEKFVKRSPHFRIISETDLQEKMRGQLKEDMFEFDMEFAEMDEYRIVDGNDDFLRKAAAANIKKMIETEGTITSEFVLKTLKANENNNFLPLICRVFGEEMAATKAEPTKKLQEWIFERLKKKVELIENPLFEYSLVKNKVGSDMMNDLGDNAADIFFAFLFEYDKKEEMREKVFQEVLDGFDLGWGKDDRLALEEFKQNIVFYISDLFGDVGDFRQKYEKTLEEIEQYSHGKIPKELSVF